MSLDVIRREVEAMGKAHQNIASQMKTELEEPFTAFAGAMKERRKIVQGGIEKLLKQKMQQTASVNKVRFRNVLKRHLLTYVSPKSDITRTASRLKDT
jgi:hypothetical protein